MKKKVLIVDDSALIRSLLKDIISSFDEYVVVATASDPHEASKLVVQKKPDIITLDIEMPKMDGLTFLRKIMKFRPTPTLIISSFAGERSQLALKALDIGAIDYLSKPELKISLSRDKLREKIKAKLDICANAKVLKKTVHVEPVITKKHCVNSILNHKANAQNLHKTDKVILIGASTGGTVAISELLRELPARMPGIVIVIHMPEHFTKSFADRLNNESLLHVVEAKNGDQVLPGKVLIARGGKHLLVNRSGSNYYVELNDGPAVNRHRPSVDVLFRSAANCIGKNAIGVILTGMGDDGAECLLELKKSGARTIAQDEESSVVFGMPKAAIKLGAVDDIMGLKSIPNFLVNMPKI